MPPASPALAGEFVTSELPGNPYDLEPVSLSLPVCSSIKWEMKTASSQSGWDFLDGCTVGLL